MNGTTNYTLPPHDVSSRACGCMGPQNGQPRCPCMMQNLRQINGCWVEVIDHGPVRGTAEAGEAFRRQVVW
jgi:hypothetical protein